MDVNEKIAGFNKLVLDDARAYQEKVSMELEDDLQNAIDEITAHTEREEEARFKAEKYKADLSFNKATITSNTEAKKSLIELRTGLMENIYTNVVGKLQKYADSKDYKDFLIGEIKKVCGGDKDATVFITPKDMRLKDEIAKQTGITPVEGDANAIGGFRVQFGSSKRIIDNTFASKLKEVRTNFNAFKL